MRERVRGRRAAALLAGALWLMPAPLWAHGSAHITSPDARGHAAGIAVVGRQAVSFHFGDQSSAPGTARTNLVVFGDGSAEGRGSFEYEQPSAGGGGGFRVDLLYTSGRVVGSDQDAVITFEAVGTICLDAGCEGGLRFTGSVRPDASIGDCLIYDIVGPNVHSGRAQFEAVGRFQVRA